MTKNLTKPKSGLDLHYDLILGDISNLINEARRSAARSVNCIMTAAYWLIGRRVVEYEQGGKVRAEYGEALLERLSADLTRRYGRGFGVVNLSQMKKFYMLWPGEHIFQTVSEKSPSSVTSRQNKAIFQTPSEETQLPPNSLQGIANRFPLPWSAYVQLPSLKNENARRFYETEALRGGWSVRQLDRQINSQFYETDCAIPKQGSHVEQGGKTTA